MSNGSELWQRETIEALSSLDEVSVKLDAGSCELQNKINIPLKPACVTHQVRGIRRLHGAVIQSCFITGPITNANDDNVTEWIAAIKQSMPRRVDMYTIARRTPAKKLAPVSDLRLLEIARRLAEESGISTRVYGATERLQLY